MAVAKKTISLPEDMYESALKRAKKMGYDTFSEYLQFLVKKDLEERPAHSFVREEKTPPRAAATTTHRAAESHSKPPTP